MYLSKEKPYYHTGLYVDIACWSVLFLLIVTMGQYLKVLNKRQEAKRVALGLPANLKDISIMSDEEAQEYRAELEAQMRAAGTDMSLLNTEAFDDLTDFK